MAVQTSRDIVQRFLAALAERDPAAAAALLAPNIVAHLPGMPAIQGTAAWEHLFGAYVSAFPDLQITVHDIISEGDTTVGRWTWQGTHRGDLMGIPATGRHVSDVAGVGVYRVVGDKIAEQWVVEDMLGMMQQLGAIPQPGRAAATA